MFSVEDVDSFEQNLTKNMYHTELRFFFSGKNYFVADAGITGSSQWVNF